MFPESSGRITADGVVGLTRAFLAAGVRCVCVSLWPVPAAASKLFTRHFYTALLGGAKASAALTEAMKALQRSKQFSHPSNWAGEQNRAVRAAAGFAVASSQDVKQQMSS